MSSLPPLEPAEVSRYARHLLLPELGEAGQRRLKGTRVLLVGAGGLGSPAALYLAAAGVGHLTVVDPDRVEVTNLQRQVLHGTGAVGRPKVESARERIRDLNPHVVLEGLAERLDAGNALALVRAHDLVVDGTDSFPTRYLVSDACVLAGRPNVHGSIFRFEGQATVLSTAGGPCYRCLYPSPPAPGEVPSCAEAGVLGVLPGLLGVIQATEALKLAAGIGEPLVGRLLLVDALGMRFRTVRVARDPACPACGTGAIRELREEGPGCATGVGGGAAAAGGGEMGPGVPEIGPADLLARLASADPPLLVDVREEHEWAESRIEGAVLAPLSRLDAEVARLAELAGVAAPEEVDAPECVSAPEGVTAPAGVTAPEGVSAPAGVTAPVRTEPGREVVLYCRSGVRSLTAGARLRAAGFERVVSLAGGILRYAAEGAAVASRR